MNIQKIIKQYQRKLRLQDWRIKFEWLDEHALDGRYGETTISMTFQEATIRLRKGLSLKDQKRTIVHELLHVRFGDQDLDPVHNAIWETGIEITARALLGEK